MPVASTFTALDTLMLPEDKAALLDPERPLLGPPGSNPMVVPDRLADFCKRLAAGEDTTARMRAAGEFLSQIGGSDLMEASARAAEDEQKGAAHTLSQAWAGIDGWKR